MTTTPQAGPPSRSEPDQITDEPNWSGVACAVGVIGVFAVIAGLNPSLFAILLKDKGINPGLIGLNSAMTQVGLLVSALTIPSLARKIGAVRLALYSLFVILLMFVFMKVFDDILLWFPARFLLGGAIGTFYVVNRTWLNEFAAPQYRGRIIGLYATVLGGGFAAGPFLLAFVGSSGWPPFLIGIIAAAVVIIAILCFSSILPNTKRVGNQRASAISFVPLAPMLMISVAMFALFDQATLALYPSFAAAYGLEETSIALDLGILHIGDVILQFALGWLCDKFGPKRIVVGCAAATALGGLTLPFVMHARPALWALLFIWGAVAYGLTTASLVELGSKFSGEQLLAGSAAFVMAGGLGGLLGPPVAGGFMILLGPNGLPVFLVIAFTLLAVTTAFYPLVRFGRNQPEPQFIK